MFAIDGPIVMKTAFSGMLASIHSPVSRTPGMPPPPAKGDDVGCMAATCHDENPNEMQTMMTAATLIHVALVPNLLVQPGCQPINVRAHRIATAGAMGRRY